MVWYMKIVRGHSLGHSERGAKLTIFIQHNPSQLLHCSNMILSKKAFALAATALAVQLAHRGAVDAHGYLKTPRSRNYHASIDPIWWGVSNTL